jgi:DNA polymerase-1
VSGPLLTLDIPWLLYRSFYAIPRSVKGRDGMPVGALLGTVNTTLALVDAFAPRAVACCLGAEDAVYRRELYAGYHAQREPMPDVLRAPLSAGRSRYTTSSRPTTCCGPTRGSRPGQAGAR